MRDQVRIAALGAAVAMFLSVAGCATFGVFETAQTAPPGRFHLGGAVTPLHIVSVTNNGYGYSTERSAYTLFFPCATLFAKVGLSDRVDLGTTWSFGNPALFEGIDLGTTWPFGPQVGLNGKFQFLRGSTDGALLLSGSYYGIAGEDYSLSYYSIGPRLLVSSEQEGSFHYMLNVGASYTGVRAGDGYGSEDDGALTALAGAGLPFRLGTDRTVRIMPELQVSIPLSTSDETWSGPSLDAFVASIGVSIGYVGAEE